MNTSENGYTLIESLVVLSAFMILSTITAFSLQPEHWRIEDKSLLTQLQADLLYAQQYAISHQHEVSVVITKSQNIYKMFMKSDIPPITERNYSTDFYITEGSLPIYFKYLADGNVNKFGTLLIQTKKKTYQLTVLIGKGRFYVTE